MFLPAPPNPISFCPFLQLMHSSTTKETEQAVSEFNYNSVETRLALVETGVKLSFASAKGYFFICLIRNC